MRVNVIIRTSSFPGVSIINFMNGSLNWVLRTLKISRRIIIQLLKEIYCCTLIKCLMNFISSLFLRISNKFVTICEEKRRLVYNDEFVTQKIQLYRCCCANKIIKFYWKFYLQIYVLFFQIPFKSSSKCVDNCNNNNMAGPPIAM